ncbi:HAD-IB family hydrolase [soil metagenome]
MKKIAFFDFDGTITTKDTMLELIKFQKGTVLFYAGFFINSPSIIAYKLKLISNQLAKERVLKYFFKGTSQANFQQACDDFAGIKLPSMIRPGALTELEDLKAQGFEIVIVSASAGNWIKKWCDNMGVRFLATQLEVENELITGKLKGHNCHGEEKVLRIRSAYDLSAYDAIYCYGDTGGDKPMLELGTKAFYKPFRQ